MAFQLSPGVNISEIDLTTVVPSVATTIGGFAGAFTWGPVNEITLINNELQLAERFGKPNDDTFKSFFTAANFLAYGTDLRVVRSVGAAAKNAVANGTALLITNEQNYKENYVANNTTLFHAKYPGTLGNSITVSIADSSTYSGWNYESYFDSAPGTSSWASKIGRAHV